MKYKDYLMHYGRLGMKWGVMNGPPYPIGTGEPTERQKKRIAKQYTKDLRRMSRDLRKKEVNLKYDVATGLRKEQRWLEDQQRKGNATKVNGLTYIVKNEQEEEYKRTLGKEINEQIEKSDRELKEVQNKMAEYMKAIDKKQFTLEQITTTKSFLEGKTFVETRLNDDAFAGSDRLILLFNSFSNEYKVKANKQIKE